VCERSGGRAGIGCLYNGMVMACFALWFYKSLELGGRAACSLHCAYKPGVKCSSDTGKADFVQRVMLLCDRDASSLVLERVLLNLI
jgi:hypothetical protein